MPKYNIMSCCHGDTEVMASADSLKEACDMLEDFRLSFGEKYWTSSSKRECITMLGQRYYIEKDKETK